ncbi:class I SAM-dependent methyltransferase [Deinococcus radiomollis]|uniref:class I SAM-dependent methyltransferase n=1 Tax=Deinococcus radiomollis TaxID=468916 RepID=UPI003892B5EA
MALVIRRLLASQVTGADVSPAMLGEARTRFPELSFVEAAAERLPFEAATFDLVTVSMAFNAFEQGKFLREARRVLKRPGWLVVYQSEFLGDMPEHPAFKTWFGTVFAPRFPQPAPPVEPLWVDVKQATGFEVGSLERFTTQVRWTPEQLVTYLTTLGRTVAVIEGGDQDLEAVQAWLLTEVRGLFEGNEATFCFPGALRVLSTQNATVC